MTTTFDHMSPEELLTEAYTRPELSGFERALCQQLELVINAYEVVCETVYTTVQEIEAGEIDTLVGVANIKAVVEPDEVETVYIQ